jgi:hypothetical protein
VAALEVCPQEVDRALPRPFLVTDLPVPDGYRAAVTVNGHEPYAVVCQWWPDEEQSDEEP